MKESKEDELITIRVINFSVEHFQKLGYDVKNGDKITIPIKHLPHGSSIKINVKCEYCGKVFRKSYRRYLATKENICCADCKKYKVGEISLKKYGNVCSLRHPDVLSKMKENNIQKFGTEYPLQNKEIWKKARMSYINNNDNRVACSKQQRHIHDLLGGELNYNIGIYFTDILLDNNICLEYDGGGHKLRVKFGRLSEAQFCDLEKEREDFFIGCGHKVFRIICDDDVLPSDAEILEVFNQATHYLLAMNYNVVYFNTKTHNMTYRE